MRVFEMQWKNPRLTCIDWSGPARGAYVNAACAKTWLFILPCMWVPSASIPPFVPIICNGMELNIAICTSMGWATRTAVSTQVMQSHGRCYKSRLGFVNVAYFSATRWLHFFSVIAPYLWDKKISTWTTFHW